MCWVSSYLTERTECVSVDGHLSPRTMTRNSIGQCLGSFTFHCVLCWTVRCLRVLRCSLTCLYADDTQLYVDFPPNDSASTADEISRCVVDVKV